MIERFSASVVARHMACHGSANLEAAIPNWTPPEIEETKAASDGTSKHTMLEQITNLPVADMRHMVRALDYVAALRSQRRFKVLTEVTAEATWLATKPKTTVDVVLYTQDEIHVIDWKTGKIPVPVVDNEQLLFYDVCFAHLAPRAKGVTNHIVQPWDKDWDPSTASWFADTNRIAQFMAEAQAAEAAIQAGSVKLGPSDHCKFCPANPHSRGAKGHPMCPAMMSILYPDRVDEDAILNL